MTANALQGSELAWRATRLAWCILSAAVLLWLLAELKLPAVACLMAGALSMWNPYRNEIWTSLTLSEGVAMPYALFALVCARRANVAGRPWAWDLAGVLAMLVALGCKNTFAALIPVQFFLRAAPDALTLRDGIRRHGLRAALLGLTILAPVAHYVYFQANWHPGQYRPEGPSWEQLKRIASAMTGAASLGFLGAGMALAILSLVIAKRAGTAQAFGQWRAAIIAGVLLLAGGVAAYLPMDAMSGRYTMPGIWGFDLLFAVAVAALAALPRTSLVRAGLLGLGCGLAAVAASSIGKQLKFAARAKLFWETLEYTERNAPPGAGVAWICGDSLKGGLSEEEGIHFRWHLAARGRGDIRLELVDAAGNLLHRVEITEKPRECHFAIWGPAQSPAIIGWVEGRRFTASYWAGRKRYDCFLGMPGEDRTRSSAAPRG